jgi:EAL and modified HD-GYP domain-containing signal transduction protein
MIGRLISWWRAEPPAPPAALGLVVDPAPSPQTDPAPAPRPPTALGVASRPNKPWRLVSRRPMIDGRGRIGGWDLRLSAVALERLQRSGAPRVLHEAYWFALAQAARSVAETPRAPLLLAPPAALTDAAFVQQLPAGAMLLLDTEHAAALGTQAAPLVAALRSRQLRLAVASECTLADAADFLVLDAERLGAAATLDRLAKANGHGHGHGWIATNLGSFEEVSAAVRGGADYCCGTYAQSSRRPQNTQVAASAVSAAQLLSAILAGRPPRDIAELFKADIGLSYRLMRLVNSAAFALGRPLESIEQAVVMLGTRELYRWLCVLMLTADSSNVLASALHETALARGRLLELLAIARGRLDPPDALFVTGAFSMLDLLLNVPLEVALALTPLPEQATEAMIAEAGPWRPYLDIALASEAGDGARLERGCTALGLDVDGTASLAVEASQWAQQIASGTGQENGPASSPAH